MQHVDLAYCLKAVMRGLRIAFSLLGQAGHPKRLAGLFAAAPSVALLYLAVGRQMDGLFIKQDQLLSKPR